MGASQEIFDQIQISLRSEDSISGEAFRAWTSNNDIQVLGAAMILLMHAHARITPEFSGREQLEFSLRYYRRCLEDNPPQDGDYAECRYLAGYSLTGWYKHARHTDPVPAEVVEGIREMLRDVYLRGDAALKLAVVHSALEHLFEDPVIVQDFEEWQRDERLRAAYDEAYAYGSTIVDVMKAHPPHE
ncbi:MAG: hypothetical protein ABJF23_15855 [Bryobacteraceae bacterium]